MCDRFMVAADEADVYENTLLMLSGAFDRHFVHHSAPMTRKAMIHFNSQALKIARSSAQSSGKRISQAMYDIASGARLQAHTDANAAFPTDKLIVNTSLIEQYLNMVYREAVQEGLRLISRMLARYGLLLSSGLSSEAARVRILEQHREDIAQLYNSKRMGRRLKPHWSVYLTLLEALAQSEHHSYLNAAAKMGYQRFYLHQPDHERDGLKFTLDGIPDKELHPQSKAQIKIDFGD